MTISIGLPFYNNSATLIDALRSIFAQTFQDWELILVDDGSSDKSLEIVRTVCDPRVRVYSDGINCGLSNRLNQIARLARAPFLARMDADDMMHPERLAKQYRFLEENPHVDLVDAAIYSIDMFGRLTGVRGRKQLDVRPQSVLRSGLLIHPTVLGRTDWFCRNPYDPQFYRAEDHELWCRSIEYTTFSRITEPLLFYREGKINLNNYLATQRTDRKILRQYGPAIVGEWRTLWLIVSSFVKGGSYWFCRQAGIDRCLVSLRNSRMRSEERIDAIKILQKIKHTSVPGLDD